MNRLSLAVPRAGRLAKPVPFAMGDGLKPRRPTGAVLPLARAAASSEKGAALAHGSRSWSRPRLQAVQIIGGLLRMAGGGEDRPLVALQHGE